MWRPFARIITVIFFCSVPSLGVDYVLDNFDIPQSSYPNYLGNEFPGAQATFSWCEKGFQSKGTLKIDYDFSEGGRYCQWACPSEWYLTKFRFYAKGTGEADLLLRLVDSTGQYHQYRIPLGNSDWQKKEIDFQSIKAEHWSGANDGVIYQPVSILLGPVCDNKTKGSLYLDELLIFSDITESEKIQIQALNFSRKAQLKVSSSVPGFLFCPEDKKEVNLSIDDVPESLNEIRVDLCCLDSYGNTLDLISSVIALSRTQSFSSILTLPSQPGYYQVLYTLDIRIEPGHKYSRKGDFSFGIIPCTSIAGRGRDPNSPFGVNTHFNQGWSPEIGKIVKKVGIGWIRDGEASLQDLALPVARANDLCYLPCFTGITDAVCESITKELERDGNLDRAWDFSKEAEVFYEYAIKYGADINVYDLVNEPHNRCWPKLLGGGWWGGDWIKAFVPWGRQVTQAIQRGDPQSMVLWEDVDQLMWYPQFYERGAFDSIAIISPHPYNLHQENPYPEDHPILKQLPEFHAFVQEHKLFWQIWSGEVGFSSFQEPQWQGFYTPMSELQQAQMLVRMMVGQLSRGVNKVFWYDFCNDGTDTKNPEHNFGILRHDLSPKPSVVAYANLIDHLRDARWLGSYALEAGENAFVYAAQCSSGPVLIAWVKKESQPVDISVSSNVKEITVTDIFGVSQKVIIKNHCFSLVLSETPVYIKGMKDTDISLYIKPIIP